MLLSGRTAVVTGAASGIGRAMAIKAAESGMSLALADIDRNALEEISSSIGSKCELILETLDVRNRDSLDSFARRVFDNFGSVALVFANAGIMKAGTSWTLSAQDWDSVLDINIKGVVHTASAFIPYLLSQEQSSRIVITGSTSSFLPRPHLTAYSCSKHALWGIAEAMQQELSEQKCGVNVSFLAPGGVNTPIAESRVHGDNSERQKSIDELIKAFGMPPADLAEYAFDALKKGRFWILPQPQFKGELENRVSCLIGEIDPAESV